ncbi:hypothetical protein M0R45_000478 [Rubus argutus]|uniref:BED-type domain-containing protein n=1 Tax=Rubus argutus TaxID=59490 RepID=A0AAW1VQ10_RUBAR
MFLNSSIGLPNRLLGIGRGSIHHGLVYGTGFKLQRIQALEPLQAQQLMVLLVLWYWLLNQLKAPVPPSHAQTSVPLDPLQKLLMISKPRAKCKYCPQTYACHSKANGTSAMRTHMLYQCRKSPTYIPAKKYRYIAFDSAENGGHGVYCF